MNSKDYQQWAISKDRTYTELADRLKDDKGKLRLLHAVMGMSEEVGEIMGPVKKHIFYNKDLDINNIKTELGDLAWFMSILLDEIGSSFEEVMRLNYDKLEKRFPNGFSEKAAIERKDKI